MGKQSTAQSSQLRFRKMLLGIITALAAIILIDWVFNPLPFLADFVKTARIRRELPQAIERWRAQGISDYQISVKASLPLTCIIDGEIQVEGDQLVGVRVRQNPLIPSTPLVNVNPDEWTTSNCPFTDLTVLGMFKRLQDQLGSGTKMIPGLDVKFDENLGYITEYHSGRSKQGGLFGGAVSDCCTWFAFDNLTQSKYP